MLWTMIRRVARLPRRRPEVVVDSSICPTSSEWWGGQADATVRRRGQISQDHIDYLGG